MIKIKPIVHAIIGASLAVGSASASSEEVGYELFPEHATESEAQEGNGVNTEEEEVGIEFFPEKEFLPEQDEDEIIQDNVFADWPNRVKIGGYIQARYNGFFETNEDLEVPQMDKGWGKDKSLTLRRVRLKARGWALDDVYVYFQADFVGDPSLRDAYFDYYFDNDNEFKFRIGQSKVPYGWENMQSSQNRLPQDRSDPINSAMPNERDLTALLYYTPKGAQDLYALAKERHRKKTNGNYGAFSIGAFNGQSVNRRDANDSMHWVVRASYPFMIKDQIIDISAHAYTGKYVIDNGDNNERTDGVYWKDGSTLKVYDNDDLTDERIGLTFVLYPNPIGFQAEYNWGKGPRWKALNEGGVCTGNIQDCGYIEDGASLKGGYAMLLAQMKYRNLMFFPFVRYMSYDGGKKFELNARSYKVNDWEIGIEWQINKAFELATMYTIADREYEDGYDYGNNYDESGNVLRLQFQGNY